MSAARLLAPLVLLPLLAAPASAAPPGPLRHTLTGAQERVVLRLVDDACGDIWCEGDHAMRFERFRCSPRRGCVLRMRLASWSQEPLGWHSRSARVLGFPRFADMVVTAPVGERSLQPSFSAAVGRAVRTMTGSVP